MTCETENTPVLQWHPAFYAGIRIEFEEEKEMLIFENEHQLGTKPKEIDVLIIKKHADVPIRKNIGRVFRKHNIVEYKSPKDYLSIDDYYKVYAYACFYKSDTEAVNQIKAEEITITFVCKKRPREDKSVMNIIVNANKQVFEEAKGMCEALLELFKDELEEGVLEGILKNKKELIKIKLAKGKTPEEIADALEDTVENIQVLIAEMERA